MSFLERFDGSPEFLDVLTVLGLALVADNVRNSEAQEIFGQQNSVQYWTSPQYEGQPDG